ncbi:MAG: hypothetical protein ABI183_14680 [Polyangiaceae bacterium]
MRGVFGLSTLSVLVLLALHTKSARADAATPKLTFTWSSPAQCTTENDVRMRVDRILGSRSAPQENVDARAVVTQSGDVFRAEIQLNSAGQTSLRHVEDASCNALADAVALIVALTVNPEAAVSSAPIETKPPENKPAETKPTEEKKSPPPSPQATSEKKIEAPTGEFIRRRPSYFGADFLLDVATLKSLGAGAEVVAGFNPRHAAFELSGTWLSTQDAHYDATQGASETSLGAGARACWEIFDSSLDVGPCGGAELTGIFAQGFGATQKNDASVALFRALLGARAKLRFSRFALRLSAEAAIPFTHPSFVIDNAGKVQDVAALTLRTTFGAEIHF